MPEFLTTQTPYIAALVLTLIFSITTAQKKHSYVFGILLLCVGFGLLGVAVYFYIFLSNLLIIYFLRSYKYRRHVTLVVSLLTLLFCSYYYKVLRCEKAHNICGPVMILVIKLYYLSRELDCDNAFYTEIFEYVFCVPSVIAGPGCSLTDFRNKKVRQINYKLGTKKLAESLLYLALHALIANGVSYSIFLEKDLSFFYKILYLVLVGFGFKSKYYFAWNFTEACYIFNGFDSMTNIKPIEAELSADMKELSSSWNIYTNKWLKDAVFNELKRRSVFLGAACTFIVSAIWHGPKLGYFFMFLGFLFGTTVIKSNYKIFSTFLSPSTVRVLGVLQTNLIVNYLIIPFSLLQTPLVYEIWKNLYYFVHVWYVVSLIGFLWTKRRIIKNRVRSRVQKQRRKSI